MKILLTGCALFLMSTSLFAQKNTDVAQAVVTYQFRNNGKVTGGELNLFIDGSQARIQRQGPQTEQQFLDFKAAASYQVLNSKGVSYTFKKPFAEYVKAELLPGIDTICGIACRKAKLFIRSNTIEVWYNNEMKLKGTPTISIAPGMGLVLKVVRNGNSETIATAIKYRKIKPEELQWPSKWENLVNEAAYQRQIIESRYATLSIFKDEQIHFGRKAENPAPDQSNVTYHFAGGTVILKKVKLPASSGGQQLFAELIQRSNGDAYDRTGSVFMIPISKKVSLLQAMQKGLQVLPVYNARNGKKYQGVTATDEYLPPLELMRFFTSFGVGHFNEQAKIKGYNWADSVVYKQDISTLLPALQGEVWIGVFIGNYDKGGHKVSLNFKYYPGDGDEAKAGKKDWIMPVFNTTNVMEMAGQEYGTMFDQDSLTVSVEVPQGVSNLRLRYLTTGHGGWGNGDEFVPKQNEIFVDGKRVYHFIPWREDCATYRMLNPASGNFGNGLSSSDLSRSNWCPGTITLPVDVPLPELKPGKHTLKVAIPLGKSEGTSFSAWSVSGVLIGSSGQ
uniref:PNGase F N-terminal domain-containing protein n=1 Tax=Pedobacter schmidteae TaxID=2201271 RepID=UPI000EB5D0BB|nr:PNGase F N-terminal domain-containing protein [Pedobacter schmidteae]